MPKTNIMITIFVKKYNSFSQTYYDNIINNIPLTSLKCPCCKHSACFVFHGYYNRNIVNGLELKTTLKITRVKCKECNSTHALILSSLIPYYRVPLKDIAMAFFLHLKGFNNSKILEHIPTIENINLIHLIHKFLFFWNEKLLSFKISLYPLEHLVQSCFSNFLTQFMQNAHIFNILFLNST